MRSLHEFLVFASDAKLLALYGAACVLVAGLCLAMERRRMRRARLDGVGWVPWTGLFMAFAITGGGLLALALPPLIGG